MPQKNNKIDLKRLMLSRHKEAEKINEKNEKKDKAFQAYTKELHKQIHKNDDQFNDI